VVIAARSNDIGDLRPMMSRVLDVVPTAERGSVVVVKA
jgi:hypothetical protein